jgi:hypothetical protein
VAAGEMPTDRTQERRTLRFYVLDENFAALRFRIRKSNDIKSNGDIVFAGESAQVGVDAAEDGGARQSIAGGMIQNTQSSKQASKQASKQTKNKNKNIHKNKNKQKNPESRNRVPRDLPHKHKPSIVNFAISCYTAATLDAEH